MELYCDYSATTPVKPEVLVKMMPYFIEDYGNPSSIYTKGRIAKDALEQARLDIAKEINCSPSEIYFTSGGTEGDNLAIKGIAQIKGDKDIYITSKIEHPAVLNCFKELEKNGYRVKYLDVDEKGIVDLEQLEDIANKYEIAFISIMAINNELGTKQPIYRIKEILNRTDNKDTIFHTDSVQLAGKVNIDVKRIPVDIMNFSGHKFGAVKGVGFIYIKDGTLINPQNLGGGQEEGMRSGTENVASIVGMAEAFKIAYESTSELPEKTLYLIELLSKIPDTYFNSPRNFSEGSAGIVNVRFDGIEASALINILDSKNVYVSAGSACHSDSDTPSHVLKAIGLSDKEALSSIRISFDNSITYEEIDYLVMYIKESVDFLRKF